MSARFSRRALLSGVGGAAALLPLLGSGRARAADAPPRRLVIVQTTNGVIHPDFWPTQPHETQFSLETPTLKSLAPYKNDLLLVGGLALQVSLDEPIPPAGGIGHHTLPHLLTGTTGAIGRIPDGRIDPVANALSVDQYIAGALAKNGRTPFKSLQLGALTNKLQGKISDNSGFISFNGPAIGANPARPQGNLPESDPYALYNTLFSAGVAAGAGNAAMDGAALTRIRARRKSALDIVSADLQRLTRTIGTAERQKLEAHLESVRQIERELDGPAPGAACTPVMTGGKVDVSRPANLPAIIKLQMDLMVSALACNLTQVVTLMFVDNGNQYVVMPWLGPEFATTDQHDITHGGGREKKLKTDQWFWEQFAYLLGAMKKVPEGNGTLLDNTVVLWANHMDDGGHTVRGMPWVLAGSCGGYFKTGRYLRYGDWAAKGSYYKGTQYVPHNGLLVALANAMGVPTKTFGDPRYGGELPGLGG